MKNTGCGIAYKDQEAAEQAVDSWRAEYREALDALKRLNESLDSLRLHKQIQFMESQLRRL